MSNCTNDTEALNQKQPQQQEYRDNEVEKAIKTNEYVACCMHESEEDTTTRITDVLATSTSTTPTTTLHKNEVCPIGMVPLTTTTTTSLLSTTTRSNNDDHDKSLEIEAATQNASTTIATIKENDVTVVIDEEERPTDALLATCESNTVAAPAVAVTATTHLPCVSSDPTFNSRRLLQQQKIAKFHETCSGVGAAVGDMSGDSDASSVTHSFTTPSLSASSSASSVITVIKQPSNAQCGIVGGGDIQGQGHCIGNISPCLLRKSSDGGMGLPRRVSFPQSDSELVTGYLEPANPWVHAYAVKSTSEITEQYVISCGKHNAQPLNLVLDNLKNADLQSLTRQPLLCLRNIHLTSGDCEALEEVFKRLKYKTLDLSSCQLDESSICALFDMIEYYEAATDLDISLNTDGMTSRGWNSCINMISHSRSLQLLNAQGNIISKVCAKSLGTALNSSNLHTLKLEHCGLRGAPLSGLCGELRHNRILKELWLAHNDLDCNDAETLADLLKVNHFIEFLDISNNDIKDEGLKRIVIALVMQSMELEKRSTMMQRTTAIDDDDGWSPVETTPPLQAQLQLQAPMTSTLSALEAINATQTETVTTDTSESNCHGNEKKMPSVEAEEGAERKASREDTTNTSYLKSTASYNDLDEDHNLKSSLVKPTSVTTTTTNTCSGQSMLDKLLTMSSSESSSENDQSNISTDTIAGCCSEDTSVISNDLSEGKLLTDAENPAKAAFLDLQEPAITICDKKSLLEAKESDKENISGETSSFGATTLTTPTASSNITEDDNMCNNNNLNNNINSNSNDNSGNNPLSPTASRPPGDEISHNQDRIFEVLAVERDCVKPSPSLSADNSKGESTVNTEPEPSHSSTSTGSGPSPKGMDVNKNTGKSAEDFDDTHSTDSAFESASEGDISRHLPEEFSRLSTSLESSRLEDMPKEMVIETATIATESTECLLDAELACSVSCTSNAVAAAGDNALNNNLLGNIEDSVTVVEVPSGSPGTLEEPPGTHQKVKIAAESFQIKSHKEESFVSPNPTPPPPSISPGGVSFKMHRTDSCTLICQSARNRSQSSDSLCSDTNDEGSTSSELNFSSSSQVNEKLTKNDTLTRQQRPPLDSFCEGPTNRTPNGLKALAIWNNNLSKESGNYISNLLAETNSLELLNIGKNILSNDFVYLIKDSLMKNTTLTTLGLQSAHLSAHGIETLASILTFGGNSTLQRIDIRDNKLEVESLNTIADVLKSNTSVTQIDIDDEPKRLSVGSEAHLDYTRVLENVRSMCARNEKAQNQAALADKAAASAANGVGGGKRRGGYYVGCRKISLTCYSRPQIDTTTTSKAGPEGSSETPSSSKTGILKSAVAVSNGKLGVQRKTGARLRSPVPSPTTISPSSSPNRSRFQVFRVNEVSPLPSPLTSTPPPTNSSGCVPISSSSLCSSPYANSQTSSPLMCTSSSLPSITTITSSTQTIKRFSGSPRSRFHVSKIVEDLRVPLAKRPMPPITPPLNPPPTPMAKHSPICAAVQIHNDSGIEIKLADVSTDIGTAEKCQVNETSTSTASFLTVSSTSPSSTFSVSPLPSSSSNSVSPSSLTSNSTSSLDSGSTTSESYTRTSATEPTKSSQADGNNSDSSHSEKTLPVLQADSTCTSTPARCPIVMFSDINDITLTKNSANNLQFNNESQQQQQQVKEDKEKEEEKAVEEPLTQQAIQPIRKLSWRANTSNVDKLLNIFQIPSGYFQRSSSPDRKSVNSTNENSRCGSPLIPPPANAATSENAMPEAALASAAPMGAIGTAVSGAASSPAEQTPFWLDVTSKQIREFGKQVFRPNLLFGCESATTMVAKTIGDNSGDIEENLINLDDDVEREKSEKGGIAEQMHVLPTIDDEHVLEKEISAMMECNKVMKESGAREESATTLETSLMEAIKEEEQQFSKD